MVVKTSARWIILSVAILALSWGCAPAMPEDPSRDNGQNFGEKFFNIICQRVAYTSSRQAHERSMADPKVQVEPVDVSGSRYRLACRHGATHLPADAASRDPKVATLVQGRTRLVKAINLIFPNNELDELQDYMVKILPLTDDDKFPALVKKIAKLIRDEFESDTDLQWSLARLDRRVGYRPRSVCLGIAREALHYPDLHPLLNGVLDFASEAGKGHKELLSLLDAVGEEMRTAQKVKDPKSPERTLNLALDLLLTQDPRLDTKAQPMLVVRRDWRGVASVVPGANKKLPAPFVDKDSDGQADINTVGDFITSTGKAAPMPFVLDKDTDVWKGRRDSLGRALDGAGKPIFQYLDLDSTLLAALGRDALQIMDHKKDVAMELPLGISALMGPRKTATQYDTSKSPLLDLLYAVLQTLRDPAIDSTLEAVTTLLQKHEKPAARLVDAMMDAKDRGKKHPEAAILDSSNAWDDLIVVVQKIVNTPGLVESLVKALCDPRTRDLPGMLNNYMKHKDIHVLDSANKKVVGADSKAAVFKTPVDRSKPDRRETSGDNRSIQMRLGHIINNTNGMKMCNKEGACLGIKIAGINLCIYTFKECELFQVDNGAVLYTKSIARQRDSKGNLTNIPKGTIKMNLPSGLKTLLDSLKVDISSVLELLSGIEGMGTNPTTEALNRLMFMKTYPTALAMLQDHALDIDKHYVHQYHVGSLLSWEVPHTGFCHSGKTCQFFDAIRPVVQAFADHEAEHLFVGLLSVFHRHWPTKQGAPFYKIRQPGAPATADWAWGSGISKWEPLVAEVMDKGDIMQALNAISPILRDLKLSNGSYALKELTKSIRYIVEPSASPSLKYRNGRPYALKTDGKTKVTCGSGNTSTDCVTPYYLFADAFAAKRAALKAARASKDKVLADAWDSSTSDLVDIFLDVNTVSGKPEQSTFKNRRFVPSTTILVNFIRKRIKAHKAQYDLHGWLEKDLIKDIEQKLDCPVLPRAVDFIKLVRTDQGKNKQTKRTIREELYALLDYLVDELNHSDAFRSTLTGIADICQLLVDDVNLVPVSQAVGKLLVNDINNPNHKKDSFLEITLRFLKPAIAADEKKVLSRVLRYSSQEQAPGKSPLQTLLDLATEVHRLKPGTGTAYVAQDFKQAFVEARDFLENCQTGLAKFFEIIKNRDGKIKVTNCGTDSGTK